MTLNEEPEEETHGFVDDPEMYIGSVRLEDDAEGMEEIEEESEVAIEVEVEVDTDAADRDAGVESGGDEPEPRRCKTMEKNLKALHQQIMVPYNSSRRTSKLSRTWTPLHTTTTGGKFFGNARGVEHYVVKQLAWLRRLPVDEAIWIEIREPTETGVSIVSKRWYARQGKSKPCS